MSELNDSSDLHTYSTAVLHILSVVSPPIEYVGAILSHFATAIKSTTVSGCSLSEAQGKLTLVTLPVVAYKASGSADFGCFLLQKPLIHISRRSLQRDGGANGMSCWWECRSEGNGFQDTGRRRSLLAAAKHHPVKGMSFKIYKRDDRIWTVLQNRFVSLANKSTLPPRRDPGYADALRTLHSAILGLCALIESVPYSVEPWMPPLTEGGRDLLINQFPKWHDAGLLVLATHATDPPPISTTIRRCASEFKKVCLIWIDCASTVWHSRRRTRCTDILKVLIRLTHEVMIRTLGTRTSFSSTKIIYRTSRRCSSVPLTVSSADLIYFALLIFMHQTLNHLMTECIPFNILSSSIIMPHDEGQLTFWEYYQKVWSR